LKELVFCIFSKLKYTLPMRKLSTLKIALFTIAATTSLFAQQSAPALTAAAYARAEKMLGFNTAPLVDRSGVRPTFLPDGRFYYRVLTPTGSEYCFSKSGNGRAQNRATEKLLLAAGRSTRKRRSQSRPQRDCFARTAKKRFTSKIGICGCAK
jgi:hypothetical protein